MKIKFLFIVLTSYFLLLLNCSKESGTDDGNTNCEEVFTITTSIFPPDTGVINYRDEAYCFGDSLLCTAVPNLNYEFDDWEFGNISPHSPPGNSAYFYIYNEESTSIGANFRLIDNSYISSSLNLLENFACDTDRYPACEVNVERITASIGMTSVQVYSTGPNISVAVLGGMYTVMTYELEDAEVTASIDPDTTVSYDEYEEVWAFSGDNFGSFTVNYINPETNTIEITFNNLYLEKSNGDGEFFFGTISAQGLPPND